MGRVGSGMGAPCGDSAPVAGSIANAVTWWFCPTLPPVPEALSALAERALHPEEPDGIHAVGAVAALLRSPETVAGISQQPTVTPVKPLSPADRRLIKERRVKLSLAAVVLAVFAVLIVIALGGLTNQFVASIQNSAPDELPMIDSGLSSAAQAATPTTDPGTA